MHFIFFFLILLLSIFFFFFFFNDTATTEIYTLSLHDALPILNRPLERYKNPSVLFIPRFPCPPAGLRLNQDVCLRDRKSTRLNSSHSQISYAVFCLKKKKKRTTKLMQSRTYYIHSMSTFSMYI